MRDNLTGIGRYTRELSYALRQLELPIDITLISPYPESTLQWYRDFPVYPVPSLKKLPAVLVKGHRVLARATATLGLDILHDPCGIAPFLSRPGIASRIVTIHDAIPLVRPELQPLGTKLVYHTLLRWTPKSSDAIITVSTHTKQDLVKTLKIPPPQIFVTPLGATIPSVRELSRWRSSLPTVLGQWGIRSRYFLWVGADSPRKNLNRVLTAFESLRGENPDIQLVLVGPMPRRPQGWPSGVQHLGFVSQSTLDVLYIGTVALLYPSLYEGFGLPILEAMSHGTPVVASTTSSMPELVDRAAILVDPYNVDDIRQAMHRCLDHDTSQTLRVQGRLRAMQFRWEMTARQTFDVYQHTLSVHDRQRTRSVAL